MMRTTRLFRYNGNFYKEGQKFRGKILPTMVACHKKYMEERRRQWNGPAGIRSSTRSDFISLKDRRGINNTIYLMANEVAYDNDTNTGGLSAVYPIYYIKDGHISSIRTSARGYYSTCMFELEPIDYFPREKDGIVVPGEVVEDTSKTFGFNADLFVKLKGLDASDDDVSTQNYNMTGTGQPIPNYYNDGYEYKDGEVVEIQTHVEVPF